MQRLMLPLLALLGLLAIACAAPPTALPQSAPVVVPFAEVLATPAGDSVPVFGTVRFALQLDSVRVTRQPAETITAAPDTLWCTPAGVCSATRPPVPTDTIVPVPVARGIPFGPFGGRPAPPFTLSVGASDPGTLVRQIAASRARGGALILAMTGGKHSRYLTNDTFDRAKWEARMNLFDTPAIEAAIAAGVADGTILGASVMDEPQVHGLGDGNSWGEIGTMTKVRVDTLCTSVKARFPTLPVGVGHAHHAFEPSKRYQVCDFVISPYSARHGSVTAYRDAALALGRRDGHAMMTALNIVDGGTQSPRNGQWLCPAGTTGGRGGYDPNCRMTPNQIRDWGRLLGVAGCGLVLWRHDGVMMADTAYQQAFKDVAATLAARPTRSCRRP